MLRERAFRERRRIDAEAIALISLHALAWWRAANSVLAAGSATQVETVADIGPHGLDLTTTAGSRPTLESQGGSPFIRSDGGIQVLRNADLWKYFDVNADWTMAFGIQSPAVSRVLLEIGRTDANLAGDMYYALNGSVSGQDLRYNFRQFSPANTAVNFATSGSAANVWRRLIVAKRAGLIRTYTHGAFNNVSAGVPDIEINNDRMRVGFGGDFSTDILLTDILILTHGATDAEVTALDLAIKSYSPGIYGA